MASVEWTEADKGAYMRFAQDVRDVRSHLAQMRFLRVMANPADIEHRLEAALDRLGAR